MTRRQSNNQWCDDIAAHPAPKIPSAKIRWKISRLDFLGSSRHPLHWLSSKGPNYQRGVLLNSADVIEGHFDWKTPRGGKVTNIGLFLHDNDPCSTDTCNPEATGLPGLSLPLSSTVFSGSGPVGLRPVSWTEKTIECLPFFFRRWGHCCNGEMVGRPNFYFFFSILQKLEQRPKKCVELHGEYVEWIPSLVAVVCLLPGRAKDVSAPIRNELPQSSW